jgi:phosphatidyl-myo-inositol dimannoside synthase
MSCSVAIFTSEFPPYPGGIGTYTFEIATAALRLGLKPVVFAPFTPPADRVDTEYEVNYCAPAVYRHSHMLQLFFMAARIVRRRRFDIVVAADLNNLIPLSALRTSARTIAVIHGTDAKSKLIRYINALTPFRPYKAFDLVASNSNFSRSLLLRNNPTISHSQAVVAPLGVSEYWRTLLSVEDIRRLTARFSIEPSRSLLLSVGRIEPRKGVMQAVSAIARLPPDLRKGVTYLIAGRTVNAGYAEDVAATIRAAGADVRLVGKVAKEELRALYHRADLLVHTATADPTAVEGFGLVILEAAACGLPALATRVDAIPEVVRDGITGILTEDGELDDIAGRLAAVIQEPSLARGMSAGCKAHAAAFTWERCARITFGLQSAILVPDTPYSSPASPTPH